MKRIIVTLSTLLLPSLSWSGIGPTSVWTLRSGASNGSNAQGCVFDAAFAGASGVDYSRQLAAQVAFTDLWVDTVNSSQLHSTATPFTSDMQGNGIHIYAGTGFNASATSWYTITDVTANIATMDRPVATAPGKQDGSGYLGGACALGSATQDDNTWESFQSSNVVAMETGTYNLGQQVLVGNDGTDVYPVYIVGYRTTHPGYNPFGGDNPTAGMRPIINTGANSFSLAGANNYNVSNIEFTGSATPVFTGGLHTYFRNGGVTNTSVTAARIAGTFSGAISTIYGSYFTSPAGTGINFGNNNFTLYGSLIFNSSNCYVQANNTSNILISDNIFSFCNSTAVNLGGTTATNMKLINNTIHCSSKTSSTGIFSNGTFANIGANGQGNVFFNNLIDNCATGTNWFNESGTNVFDNNNYFNNTVNFSSAASNQHHNTTFVDPGFANTSSWQTANYSIGPVMRGAGIPSAFSNQASTGAIDMGAVQSLDSISTQQVFRNATFRGGTLR